MTGDKVCRMASMNDNSMCHCNSMPSFLLFFNGMLLLCCFSRVQLCATPQTAAHQTPPSLGFSRQEHWSGLPFPSPTHESESKVAQSYLTLSDPMDRSLPDSSAPGIFQARELEWGAIAFSSSMAQYLLKSMLLYKENICRNLECYNWDFPSPWIPKIFKLP